MSWNLAIGVLCTSAFFSEAALAKDAVERAQERSLFALINAERIKAEQPPLRAVPVLIRIARAHSANMARQQKLAHTLNEKTFAERIADAGYRAGAVGENIAQAGSDATEAVAIWLDSPSHKANLLSADFKEIGVGIATDTTGRVYYTLVFAAPAQR